MDALGAGATRSVGVEQDAFRAVANFVDRADYGTLILDRLGRIASCGASAERLLGACEARLIGRRIVDFIPDLLLNDSSPSFSARYLVHLCNGIEWCKFAARDSFGRPLAIEIKLMPMTSSGGEKELILLNLRRNQGQGSLRHSS